MRVNQMFNRITPPHIINLASHEVFVFGSNEAGHHGRGAAAMATRWGAKQTVPKGRCGQTYAIPTKPVDVRFRLPLRSISKYVDDFVEYTRLHNEDHFLVTEIGCGLAGYTPVNIAPLFRGCIQLENISLPLRFWTVLTS